MLTKLFWKLFGWEMIRSVFLSTDGSMEVDVTIWFRMSELQKSLDIMSSLMCDLTASGYRITYLVPISE